MCKKLHYCARKVDPCIQNIVTIINKIGSLKTLASCCGHDKYTSSIVVKDTRDNQIYEYFSDKELEFKKCNRYYKKDKEGFYYIPSISKLINPN